MGKAGADDCADAVHDAGADSALRGTAAAMAAPRADVGAPVNWLALRQSWRDRERTLLPFVETLEDLEILDAIGAYGELGKPCTYKELRHAGFAATATLQRRLRRLVSLGAITQAHTERDRRYRLLALTEATAAAMRQLERCRWLEGLRALHAQPMSGA